MMHILLFEMFGEEGIDGRHEVIGLILKPNQTLKGDGSNSKRFQISYRRLTVQFNVLMDDYICPFYNHYKKIWSSYGKTSVDRWHSLPTQLAAQEKLQKCISVFLSFLTLAITPLTLNISSHKSNNCDII